MMVGTTSLDFMYAKNAGLGLSVCISRNNDPESLCCNPDCDAVIPSVKYLSLLTDGNIKEFLSHACNANQTTEQHVTIGD